MNEDLKKGIITFMAISNTIGIIFAGLTMAPMPSEHKPRTNCEYHSIASVINPGYIVTCELFKQRF